MHIHIYTYIYVCTCMYLHVNTHVYIHIYTFCNTRQHTPTRCNNMQRTMLQHTYTLT